VKAAQVRRIPASTARFLVNTRGGWRSLGKIAFAEVFPSAVGDVDIAARTGVVLTAPARDRCWWPIVEVILDDSYRLGDLIRPLVGQEPVVLDIGAHVGSFSVAITAAVDGARCVAYEPSSWVFPYLARNVEANGLADRVVLVNGAVAGAEGELWFPGDRVATEGGKAPQRVHAVTFDDAVLRAGGSVDLVKMDCEGSEYDIVAASSTAAWVGVRALVIELHPAPRDVRARLLDRLTELGFREQWRDEYPDTAVLCLTRT
jgi:FkbM family methyltransferase